MHSGIRCAQSPLPLVSGSWQRQVCYLLEIENIVLLPTGDMKLYLVLQPILEIENIVLLPTGDMKLGPYI